jgi:CDP-diacylglycerol--glycerol-3-phosphate 3-phosphatidyltransferase
MTNPASERSEPPSRMNLPNALGVVRLAGAPVACAAAWEQVPLAFGAVVIVMLLTDLFDGRLARAWKQQTALGALIDSVADAAMYASIALGMCWLYPEAMRAEAAWIGAAIGSYALSVIASLIRFGRWPSYHTLAAKTGWLTVGVGVLALLAGGPVWPLRLAMVCVTLTNLEATAITCVLRRRLDNVPTLLAAIRLR